MGQVDSTTYSGISDDKKLWIEELVDSGFALVRLIPGTKRALETNWQNTSPDPELTVRDFPDNYGVVLRDEHLVIDVDPRKFEPGDDPYQRLKQDMGLAKDEDFDTYTVRSRIYQDGHAGLHIYFKKETGHILQTHSKKYGKGIEVKSYGSLLVGPGSVHPDTGKPYVVVDGYPDELLECPTGILKEFQRLAPTDSMGMAGYTDDEVTVGRYIDYLEEAPIAIQGASGDNTTLLVAMKGRDYNLSEEKTYALMLKYWNSKCAPPWSEAELATKVGNAYRYAKDHAGNLHPETQFDSVVRPKAEIDKEQWRKDKVEAESMVRVDWAGKYDKNLQLVELFKTVNNVKNHFIIPSYKSFVNDFHKLVKFNSFTNQVEFIRKAPWHVETIEQWRDIDTVQLRAWFSKNRRWDPNEKDVYEGMLSYAVDNAYHPVRDYLSALRWDGVSRISNLFPYYAGAEDNDYTREVSRRLMIAMVARVMKPGCQHDHVIVLEGDQGTGKSTFCRILGGSWYADIPLDPKNKDTVLNIQGAWVVELSEMSHMSVAEHNAVKMFISRGSDVIRKPYGRHPETVPRQSIFIGTINPDDMGYLKDRTGNRRYWPIKTTVFKNDELERDRDQLLAEAVYCWQQGEQHHITDDKILKFLSIMQADRIEVDAWETSIANWLSRENNKYRPKVTIELIANEALNINSSQINRSISMRIGYAMKALGWKHKRWQDNNIRSYGYENPLYDESFLLTEGI